MDSRTFRIDWNTYDIKNKTSRTIPEIRNLLSLDTYSATIDDIAERKKNLKKSEQKQLLMLCKTCFNNRNLIKDTSTRISVVKIILTFLPESENIIKELINKKHDKLFL